MVVLLVSVFWHILHVCPRRYLLYGLFDSGLSLASSPLHINSVSYDYVYWFRSDGRCCRATPHLTPAIPTLYMPTLPN